MFQIASLKRVAVTALAAVAASCLVLAGCASSDSGAGAGAASKASSAAASASTQKEVVVKVGTMPNEHLLPLWVAKEEGLFDDYTIDVDIVTFDSAQALSAAIAAGEVDMAMVDVPRAVKLCESGTPVVMEWVTLGSTPGQGAFGVMAPADAPYSTLQELADYFAGGAKGAGVGVAANTVPEYVYDKLLEKAGVAADAIPTEEVASLPERYSLMASGKLAAAALPGSMLELGKASGMKLLAEDTEGEYSFSVMVARDSFVDTDEGEELVAGIGFIWDQAVNKILSNPAKYAPLLAETANLNESIADSYPVGTYPYALSNMNVAHPLASFVDPQIEWMAQKGYSSHEITYDQATGKIAVG